MLTITVVTIVTWFTVTLLGDARPVLGLDLQGGISIVLFPVKGQDLSKLGVATQIIRSRVDGLGIAEPDVNQQGGTIVVDLPGVKDRCRAESLVGETAELRFRPVTGVIPYSSTPTSTSSSSTTSTTVKGQKSGTTTTTAKPTTSATGKALPARHINAQPIAAVHQAATTSTSTGATTSTTTGNAKTTPTTVAPSDTSGCSTAASGTAATTSTTSTTTPSSPSTTGKALPARHINAQPIAAVKAASPSSTAATTPTTKKGTTATTAPATQQQTLTTCKDGALVTPRDQDIASKPVILPDRPGKNGLPSVCYVLGPTLLTGKGVRTASSIINNSNQWAVDVKMKNNDFVNKVATPNLGKQIAIVLDGVVQSAPTIDPKNPPTGKDVEISGSFTGGEASNLALVLRYGSLPIQFDNNQRTVQNVSPTLGKDQLRAGIAAGLIGLALVALYMIFFYRLLGLVVWTGIALTAMVFYSFLTYMSSQHGLTLTLAGVTGIIVSVGVTVDSYVVFFERLKDEVRTGKTIRSSLETAWKRAWRTIVAADAVSLLGAAVLYLLAVGSVRGFALFLGISTLLDLLLAVTFMHPAVTVLCRRPHLVTLPGFGIATGLDVPGVTA
jgi:preprotein translocase subunit SecD